jgi:hypothetical protein
MIRDVIAAAWNDAVTENTSPRIHTGWFNAVWKNTPQVTVTHPFEYTHQGGVTGFRAFAGDGSLVRHVFVDVTVTVWATHDMFASVNGKDLMHDMSNEVVRIIDLNRISLPELEWMVWLGKTEPTPDLQADPILFKQGHDVRLFYTDVV